MKYTIISIILVLIIGLFSILIINNKRIIDIEFYSIPENHSYVYAKDKKMSLNVYSKTSKPLIYYENKNTYTLKLDTYTIKLDDVEIEGIEYDDYYLIKYKFNIPYITDDEYISLKFDFVISNFKYDITLNMGTLSILNDTNFKLVNVSYLKAIYTEVDDELLLCGINLKFNNDIYNNLYELKIGSLLYANLDEYKNNLLLDSVIDIYEYIPDYDYLNIKSGNNILINKDYYIFIPINYSIYNLVREGYITFNIDNEYYYFDSIPFLATTPKLNEFNSLVQKGEMNYA